MDQSHSQVGLNLAGRFFHNLSLEQMISVRANLGFGMFYPDQGDSERLLLAGIELGNLYNITDRLLVQSAITLNYDKVGSGDNAISDRVIRINSAITYFIEDNIHVTANIAYRNDKEDRVNFDRTRSDYGINVALRYFFLRGMN